MICKQKPTHKYVSRHFYYCFAKLMKNLVYMIKNWTLMGLSKTQNIPFHGSVDGKELGFIGPYTNF